MRRILLSLLLGSATVALLQAQPRITSLQSGPDTSGPKFGAAITSGTPLPTFTLYINGNFDPNLFDYVHWQNTVTGVTEDFFNEDIEGGVATALVRRGSPRVTVTNSQIVVVVPVQNLVGTPLNSPQTVNITVFEFDGSEGLSPSNAAAFTLNPILSAPVPPVLPIGTTGLPYSATIFSGGTPPYTVTLGSTSSSGPQPPGLNFQNSQTISGIPTLAGLYQFSPHVADAWGNTITPLETIEIVSPATLTGLVPNAAAAGSNSVQVTATGTNFVGPVTAGFGISYPGSTIVIPIPGSNIGGTPVPTTVVNATTAIATIPASLLASPAQFNVAMLQPSNVQSNSLPFAVLAPAITTVSPNSVITRSTPVTLTVTGTNFLAGGSGSPGTSTILVNGNPVATTFVNSTTLTASLVLPNPGLVPIQVENPAGSLSNTVNVTVTQAPTITSVTPNPFSGGRLTVNGTNFTNTMTVQFNGAAVSTTFVNNGQLTATVPANMIVGATAQITVATVDGYVTPPFQINLGTPIQITTVSIPSASTQQPYDAKLAATGGTTPYTWTASGLPQGLSINPATGEITGTTNVAGNASVSVTVTDVNGVFASKQYTLIVQSLPAITNVTPNPYPGGTLTVTGINFASGMTILFNGTAIPTNFVSAGQLTGAVPANLLVGASALITVQASTYITPPFKIFLGTPVQITTTSIPTIYAQQPYDAKLAATGGNQPYTWTATGLPQGLSINASTGEITGTTNPLGTATITVTVTDVNGLTASMPYTVSILAAPAITSVTPSPFPGGTLTVNGINFASGMTILFNGTAITTNFVSAVQLTGGVPSSLFVGSTALVSVKTPLNFTTPATRIILGTPVQITTTSIPVPVSLQPYDVKLAATGGTPPYTWSARGLPQGLSINTSTGEISGTTTAFGNFTISVTVTDVNGLTASTAYTPVITPPAAPPQINSTQPPTGFVGVSYSYTFTSSGGNGAVTFGLGSGSVPPGLILDNTGLLKGNPTTAGTYTFTVIANDTDGLTSSATFTVLIKPQPLNIITSGPLASVTVGSGVSVSFTAFGGVPPYTFSTTGTLPPGTSMAQNGTLSGTATTAGTFSFSVVVNDSVQTTPGTKSFSITVNPVQLTLTGSLGDGQLGVAYSATIGAAGGVPPYTITVTGLPAGLSSANGVVSGTPTALGPSSVSVTVTDAARTSVSQTFTVTITAPPLTVTTTSLPNGTVNVAYSASLSATGGSGKYSWSVSGLPPGLSANSAGAITGTPTTAGPFSVAATVTDTATASPVVSASQTFSVTIAAGPLTITTSSLANAVTGAAYSASLAATGGVPPYTWSATGLPSGLSISSGGAITGTATTNGTATVAVTVKDSAGTTASHSFQLIVGLPSAPTLNLTGLPPTTTPASQSTVTVGIGAAFPVNVTVILTLTFTATSGPDDPTVQFATGGRTVTLTIPAGSTTATTTVGVQTGTVAGTATITAQLLAGTQDITPTPAPTSTVKINSVAPVITSVTATSNSTGFTVTVIGFATSRSITQAVFTFTPASGVNLQTTSVTISATGIFSTWYSSTAAVPFGSQFSFTQPFTVTGGTAAVSSVSVTLTNGDGTSAPVSAAVH